MGGEYRRCSRVAACESSKSGGESRDNKGRTTDEEVKVNSGKGDVVDYIEGNANSMVSMRRGGTVVVGMRRAVRASFALAVVDTWGD